MKSKHGVLLLIMALFVLSAISVFGQSDQDSPFGSREWGEYYQGCGNGSGKGGNGRGLMGGFGRNGRGNYGGMMGGPYDRNGRGGIMGNRSNRGFTEGERIALSDASESVELFLENEGLTNLEIAEVMEFEQNFYAIIRESDTGIGAMELLVNPYTGYVSYEPGPNMMWNTKYGYMGRRWWRPNRSMSLSKDEAISMANEALSTDGYNLEADNHADEFYGYYTLHVLDAGEIVGMLSVNGFDGSVWYHDWHGEYLGMTDRH